jgi:ATP-dependent helicase HrpA
VIDAAGRELASNRDIAALRAQLGEAAQLSFAEAGPSLERRGQTRGRSAICRRPCRS